MPNCKKLEIVQTYLKSDPGEEIRIRQRGADGSYIYFETHKKYVSGPEYVETERRLTKDEYLERLVHADPYKRPIIKDRYCLADGNQYFEIDVFPFWTDKAILEIKLTDPDEEIRFPKEVKLIREVTDDNSFRNASLAAV